jgi:predicted Zn-dependent protease
MGIFGVARSRNYELEADGYAVRLMNGAGYQPTAGISFLRRSQQRLWWAFSLDHPGFGSRIKTVANEIGREQQSPVYRQAAVRPAAPLASAALAPAAPVMPNASVVATASRLTTPPVALAAMSDSEAMPSSTMWAQSAVWRIPGRVSQP